MHFIRITLDEFIFFFYFERVLSDLKLVSGKKKTWVLGISLCIIACQFSIFCIKWSLFLKASSHSWNKISNLLKIYFINNNRLTSASSDKPWLSEFNIENFILLVLLIVHNSDFDKLSERSRKYNLELIQKYGIVQYMTIKHYAFKWCIVTRLLAVRNDICSLSFIHSYSKKKSTSKHQDPTGNKHLIYAFVGYPNIILIVYTYLIHLSFYISIPLISLFILSRFCLHLFCPNSVFTLFF